MPYNFGPLNGTRFPARSAELAWKGFCNGTTVSEYSKLRALDIGCAVGGSSFQLTKFVGEVVGLDFSQHFVDAANVMKAAKRMPFEMQKQGDIFTSSVAELPADVDPSRASFVRGDACNLDPALGMYFVRALCSHDHDDHIS